MSKDSGQWAADPWTSYLRMAGMVQRHARIVFRDVQCPGRRDDLVQEAQALGWAWYLRLAERGKDPWQWPSAFCTLVVRAVADGRRLAGGESVNEPLDSKGRRARNIMLEDLDPLADALADNMVTPIPEQVAFRLDFPAWLDTCTQRDRETVKLLMVGTSTGEAAGALGVSAGRVSQLRRELAASWALFV